MSMERTFVIRRALVVPIGLLIVLMAALMVVCIVQGQPLAKIVILAVMIVPPGVFFVETAFRRLVIDQEGVTAFRPFRQRRVRFAEVTSLESVRVRSRVFLTLVAGDDDFIIISNSYGDFPDLVQCLVAAIPEGTLTEEAAHLAQRPPIRQADVFTAWFAVIALLYVLIAQFKS